MIRFLLKHTFSAMSIAATIGGLLGLIQLLGAQDDYALTLYKKSETRLVQKSTGADEVVITCRDQKVDAIHRSKFTLTNTGKKALTKDFIYEPLTLTPPKGVRIIQVHSQQPIINLEKNQVKISWDLLNPGESISFDAIATAPLAPILSGRVKEVPRITFRDELKDPPSKARLKNISIFWAVLAILSVYMVFSTLRLYLHDAKLQTLLNFTKNTPINSIGRKDFVSRAVALYTAYHKVAPHLFVRPQKFSDELSSVVGSTGKMNKEALAMAHKAITDYALHANLYYVRAYGIIFGPMLFSFCLIRLLVALI